MRRRAALLMCVALTTCQDREPTAPAAAPADIVAPAEPVPPASAAVPEPAPPAPGPAPAPPEPAASTAGGRRLAAAALEGGALVVWARHDGETTDLLARRLDASGLEVGAARSIHRTPGEVIDLEISQRDGHAWVAWQSLLASEPQPRALVGALRLAADLSAVGATIVVDRYGDEGLVAWPDSAGVRVLARPGGDAVLAASGAASRCTDIVTHRRTRCPGFGLFHVRGDGGFQRAAHFGADGGQPALGALVDVGAGALVDAWAWHGGAVLVSSYAPHGERAVVPPFRVPGCRPPFERGFTGAALVTVCTDDYAADNEHCFIDGRPADEGSCSRVHAVRLDERPRTPGPAATTAEISTHFSREARCHDGHPVVDVGWGTGELRLDPRAPGASLRLPELGIWTGQYALFIAEDGAVARSRCVADAFVPAEPAPPLTLEELR